MLIVFESVLGVTHMWGLESALEEAAQQLGGSSGARMSCPRSTSTAIRPGRVGNFPLLYVIYRIHLLIGLKPCNTYA